MKNQSPFLLDKNFRKKAYKRAAFQYDKAAVLQHEIGLHLLERLELIKIEPQVILNLGSATGFFSEQLQLRYPSAQVISLEISQDMHRIAKAKISSNATSHFVTADLQHLPLAAESIDLIFSNLSLHWYSDIFEVLQECRHIIKPEGLFLFSTLGPDTLQELRIIWAGIDNYAHVHAFLDMHDIGDILLEAGFADPVMDKDYITLYYSEVRNLFSDLKNSGATNGSQLRLRGLTSGKTLQRVMNEYTQLTNTAGKLPATFEIIYAHSWGSQLHKAKRASLPGEFYISIEDIKKSI